MLTTFAVGDAVGAFERCGVTGVIGPVDVLGETESAGERSGVAGEEALGTLPILGEALSTENVAGLDEQVAPAAHKRTVVAQ